MKARITIVDDEPLYLRALSRSLSDEYQVKTFTEGKEFLSAFIRDEIPSDAVLLDFSLRDSNAQELIPAVMNHQPAAKIILISGEADVEQVINCVKLGAFDYMEKPVLLDNLRIKIRNAVAMSRIEVERYRYQRSELEKYAIRGSSRVMNNLRGMIRKVASNDGPVLVQGESGTGKELVARQLHLQSQRSGKPFQAVNCAAINRELAASALFGHVKGAFTGAAEDNAGHAQRADGGTLFLDEIGEMPAELQVQLLRFLETGEYHRVGDSTVRSSDVRIVAATNRSLQEMVDDGTFRKDLFYRLNVIEIETPALRHHPMDIPHLFEHFSAINAMRGNCFPKELSQEAVEALQRHEWPGNVRELKNFVDKASLLVEADVVSADDVERLLHPANSSEEQWPSNLVDPLETIIDSVERQIIIERLEQHGGNVSDAARSLGLHRSNLYRRISRLGIELK